MATLIRQVRIIDPKNGLDLVDDVLIDEEQISIAPNKLPLDYSEIFGKGLVLAPGLIDLHVHFREPGQCHKEDIASGIRAALAGGVCAAMVMPNTSPSIDEPKKVLWQLKIGQKNQGFHLMVAAAASRDLAGEQMTDLAGLKKSGALAITDDGRPILSNELMKNILRSCRKYDLLCMQHAEDTGLSCGAPMNQGIVSERLKITGQPEQAEYELVERDLNLVEEIGARYHVLHLSTAKAVDLIKKARRKGLKVSAEVSPHHLFLCEDSLTSLDTNKKMNPPLRTKHDQWALINGLNDGSIDAVASDHAPHHQREKKMDFTKAPFGVVGVETSISVLLSLVKQGKLALNKAIDLMSSGPAKVLGLEEKLGCLVGENAAKNAVLIDPKANFVVSYPDLFGRSKNSAFLGLELTGRVMLTFLNGKIVYRYGGF